MANTWQAAVQAVTYAANKYMMDLFNSSSSARYIRVYRIAWFNNQTSAVTGALNALKIYLSNSASGGSTGTPIAMDSSNSVLDANTTFGTGRTVGENGLLRALINSPDEPAVSTLDWDSLGTLVPFATLWDVGYGDSTVQPLTFRASENRGVTLKSVNQAGAAIGDGEILFTDAAS